MYEKFYWSVKIVVLVTVTQTKVKLLRKDNISDKSTMSGAEEKKKLDLDMLEEDDEFEEFPADDWDIRQEDQTDIQVWEDSWDDDNTESDFARTPRSELESQGNIQEQK